MIGILDKKEFYRMLLRDRFPIAQIVFPIGKSESKIEFYSTPMGTLLLADVGKSERLNEVKLYDRNRASFAIRNVFCGDGLIEIGEGRYASVSAKLQIGDVVGREFLIRTASYSIVARAEMLPRRERNIDKSERVVYN